MDYENENYEVEVLEDEMNEDEVTEETGNGAGLLVAGLLAAGAAIGVGITKGVQAVKARRAALREAGLLPERKRLFKKKLEAPQPVAAEPEKVEEITPVEAVVE